MSWGSSYRHVPRVRMAAKTLPSQPGAEFAELARKARETARRHAKTARALARRGDAAALLHVALWDWHAAGRAWQRALDEADEAEWLERMAKKEGAGK